ncbi:bifunctional oligoribonuclease/PAP phosphatase NrnA [Mycoplasma sp. 1018B]|uniref:DHH family phosphoesterase n=1 Tax=Mycoplasma sp. 1018B TaxID=2967302 RepID=UPI00211C441C|nr:bifunctional oligoribonuclease/PAP phosphatase NrnA [Mycoplasma sp. 1018B]UUM19283.1 bifunctional oligoribonuclease/PAP phosphatase NrnA [Mycoplasma sp. 1018B]
MHIGSWQEITEKIEKYDSIVIFHHIRPDGDCLGSQFGLKELLKLNYPSKQIYAVGDSKGAFSNFMKFNFDQYPNENILKKSLAVIVDANFKERIEARELLDKNLFAETIRIDHHPNEDDLDQCTRWVESSRIAACEMIAELAFQNNWQFNQQAANYVFLGLVTDSGRFSFNDVSARTHELAAYLYEQNLDAEKIFSGLAATQFSDLKLQSILLANLKTVGKVAYTTINYATIQQLNKKPNECVRVNSIGNIVGFPLWVQFLEEEDGRIRVEYRSNGPIVRNVAIKWGGGGHERASGSMLTSFDDIDDVIKDCNEEVERYLKEKNKI